jgi:hypothetical protein
MIEHIRQPGGSKVCGHSCLAMILGIPLEQAIGLIGHRHGTRTRELLKHLGTRALDSRLRVITKKLILPDFALLKVRWADITFGHYVLKIHKLVHDPELPIGVPIEDWNLWIISMHGKVTSYLPVSHCGNLNNS